MRSLAVWVMRQSIPVVPIPLPRADPWALAFLKKWALSPGWGHISSLNAPGWGRKKRTNAPPQGSTFNTSAVFLFNQL